jgi:hypothetical protein
MHIQRASAALRFLLTGIASGHLAPIEDGKPSDQIEDCTTRLDELESKLEILRKGTV